MLQTVGDRTMGEGVGEGGGLGGGGLFSAGRIHKDLSLTMTGIVSVHVLFGAVVSLFLFVW